MVYIIKNWLLIWSDYPQKIRYEIQNQPALDQ
jgi:hypothetical protein